MSLTQYSSKKWLVDTLRKYVKPDSRVIILGGWFGTYTVPMLKETIKPASIILNDVDNNVLEAAQDIHPDVKIACFDVGLCLDHIHNMDVDVIINTSCEHMLDMKYVTNKNPDCIFAFQSCDNANDPGHINVPENTTEFFNKTGIKTVLFAGRQGLGHKNRFMIIGQK